jgi:CDP-paratose 2-epimerase
VKSVLITGGAGFIGSNLADRLATEGLPVTVFDSLSRPHVERNLFWLHHRHGARVTMQCADVRDALAVRQAVAGAQAVFHFAAQVAVTASLESPVDDFEVNTRGTLNVLEALRACPSPPPLIFASTSRVYGALGDVPLSPTESRYVADDAAIATHGVDESRPLDFHSPYGCSKGAADQYVLDYARSYGLPAVVLRMSCIYGPRQFGSEHQGFVAHLLRSVLAERPVTIYGDGRQVRDVLFIDDLIEALLVALRRVGRISGRAFNVGGGPRATLSLLELLRALEVATHQRPQVRFERWRTGDRKYYVSDTRRFASETGWGPRVGVGEGLRRLQEWLDDQLEEPGASRGGEARA